MRYFLYVPIFFFVGCAGETYHLGTATKAAHGNIQGNATNITVVARPNYYYFHADKLDNSGATRAALSPIISTAKVAAKMYSPLP